MRAGFDRIGRDVGLSQAKAQCLDKRKFDSRNAARDKAALLAKRHPEWEPQFPYRCTLCHGWHLTRTRSIDYRGRQGKPMPRLEHPQAAAQNPADFTQDQPQEHAMKKPAKKMPAKPGKKPMKPGC